MCFCSVLHHTVRKRKCLCPGVQGRSSLVDLLLAIPLGLVWSSQQSRGGTAQWLHSSGEGAAVHSLSHESKLKCPTGTQGKACNRAWWKLKAMEYFTSAPFSHLLSTIPWLPKNLEKRLPWPSGISSTLGIWEAGEQSVLDKHCHW